jgi:hypothetical protein
MHEDRELDLKRLEQPLRVDREHPELERGWQWDGSLGHLLEATGWSIKEKRKPVPWSVSKGGSWTREKTCVHGVHIVA